MEGRIIGHWVSPSRGEIDAYMYGRHAVRRVLTWSDGHTSRRTQLVADIVVRRNSTTQRPADIWLSASLHWTSLHQTTNVDVVVVVGLLADNNCFLRFIRVAMTNVLNTRHVPMVAFVPT